jgi:hypothetical protein
LPPLTLSHNYTLNKRRYHEFINKNFNTPSNNNNNNNNNNNSSINNNFISVAYFNVGKISPSQNNNNGTASSLLPSSYPRLIINDPSGVYEPLIKVYPPNLDGTPSYPILYLNALPGACPFINPSTPPPLKKLKAQHHTETAGYCELCQVYYTVLYLHLASHKHITNINNPNNFKNLINKIADFKQTNKIIEVGSGQNN